MKIYLGADHNGFALKEKIKEWLAEWKYEYDDKGAYSLDPGDDYPDFIVPAAIAVAEDPDNRRAIVLGFSGQAEAMAANRIKHVRAAVYYGEPKTVSSVGKERQDKSKDLLTLTREDNNANVLSLGAGFLSDEEAREAIHRWLQTPFHEEERHVRRLISIENG